MTAPSYTSWHVGMKVVALHDHRHAYCGAWIKAGVVYTIRKIFMHYGDVVLYLVEQHLPIHEQENLECGWFTRHFRPAQTRQTDISMFQAMLSPKPAKAKKVRA